MGWERNILGCLLAGKGSSGTSCRPGRQHLGLPTELGRKHLGLPSRLGRETQLTLGLGRAMLEILTSSASSQDREIGLVKVSVLETSKEGVSAASIEPALRWRELGLSMEMWRPHRVSDAWGLDHTRPSSAGVWLVL